jgi:hypothetical protein
MRLLMKIQFYWPSRRARSVALTSIATNAQWLVRKLSAKMLRVGTFWMAIMARSISA